MSIQRDRLRYRYPEHAKIAGKTMTTPLEQQISVDVALASVEHRRRAGLERYLDDLPLELMFESPAPLNHRINPRPTN
jgi:hypothetical protein